MGEDAPAVRIGYRVAVDAECDDIGRARDPLQRARLPARRRSPQQYRESLSRRQLPADSPSQGRTCGMASGFTWPTYPPMRAPMAAWGRTPRTRQIG